MGRKKWMGASLLWDSTLPNEREERGKEERRRAERREGSGERDLEKKKGENACEREREEER
eukprot:scaffold119029_cov22-Tisochrysis_lutea.AAC.1